MPIVRTLSAVLLGFAVPGMAQNAGAEPLTASKAFREASAAVGARLAEGDVAGANASLSALQPASPGEKYMAGSLALEVASRRGDMRAQRAAVKAMLASGAAPAQQTGYLRYLAGYFSAQIGEGTEAAAHLQAARQLGYDTPPANLLLADLEMRRHRPAEALAMLDAAIARQTAAGMKVPVAWFERGTSMAYTLKNWPLVASYSARRLAAPSTPADWRSAIVNYISGAAPQGEAQLDLYRLQYATDAMASERDFQAYAALALAQGYASEARMAIEAGRSKGTLLTSDAAINPLFAKASVKAKTNLAEMQKLSGKSASAASAAAASAAGDRLLSGGQYGEAVGYYRAALAKAGVDRDRVSARLGIALARSGDLAGAQSAFALVTGPWRDVAAFWSSWATNRSAASPTAPSGN